MKPALTSILILSLVSLLSAETLTDAQRLAKLQAMPIAVYPEFDVKGSALVTLLNQRARAGDAIVVSYTDAMKGSFRVEQLGLQRADVWIYVSGEVDFNQAYRKNFAGAKGVVFVPPARGLGGMKMLHATTARMREDANIHGMRFIAGLEEADWRLNANAAEIARHAEVVTIYLPKRIRSGGAEFRQALQRAVGEVRAANPNVEIELAVPTGATSAATQLLSGLAFANADLVDRLGIYCEDTPQSFASLDLMLSVFRPN